MSFPIFHARSRHLPFLTLLLLLAMSALPALGGEGGEKNRIEAAKALMAAGRYEDALIPLREKFSAEADRASYFRAQALRRLGRSGEARVCILPLASSADAPLAAKARMLLASIHLDRKDFEEAERLLQQAARDLLSEERKRALAAIYLEIVDKAVAPASEGSLQKDRADWNKALRLLGNLSALELPADVKEQILMRRAEVALAAGRHGEALGHARACLEAFDPWYVEEVQGRLPGMKELPPAGLHVARCRLTAIEAALREADALPEAGELGRSARNVAPWIHALLDDLLLLWEKKTLKVDETQRTRALWLRPFVAGLTRPLGRDGNEAAMARRAVTLARRFVHLYPGDPRAIELLRHLPPCLGQAGFIDDALAAYDDLLESRSLGAKAEGNGISPERLRSYQAEALFGKARTLVDMGRHGPAIELFRRYLRDHPNGSQWQQAQEAVFRSQGAMGLAALAEANWSEARKLWTVILGERGLAPQAGWLDLALAQTWSLEIEARRKKEGLKERDELLRADWERAESKLAAVARRWPGAVAQEAEFRRGEILRHGLGRLEEAVAAYRKSGLGEAQVALDELTRVELELLSPRVFRSNETPVVELRSRNVEELTVRSYAINLADFFRKYHGTENLSRLDLDLVRPDGNWKTQVTGYRRHGESTTAIPLRSKGPGAWAVTVEGADHEATVLVLQSDLEIITAHSKKEVLVLVKNALKEEPVADADVTVWAGEKKTQTLDCKSGKDGVARGQFEDSPPASPYVFVHSGAHVAMAGARLPVRGAQSLRARGYLYTSRPVYLPGEVVHGRAILRELREGSLVAVENERWKAEILGPDGRILLSRPVETSPFGTFTFDAPLPADAPLGTWVFRARSADETRSWSRSFQVRHVEASKVWIELRPECAAALAGDRVKVAVKAAYFTGLPLRDRPIVLRLPDGRSLGLRSNDEGEASFEVDTSPFFREREIRLEASLPGEDVHGSTVIHLAPAALKLELSGLPARSIAGQTLDLNVSCAGLDDKPLPDQAFRLEIFAKKAALVTSLPERILERAGLASATVGADGNAPLLREELRTGKDGRFRRPFLPEVTGRLRIVVTAADGRGREQVLSRSVEIEKAPSEKLAFETKEATVTVGQQLALTVRNDDRAGLGLLLFTADRILSYRVHLFQKGRHGLTIPIGHEHFPGFALLGLATGEGTLHRAEQSFRVHRRLDLTMKIPEGPFAPGSEVRVELLARDHDGKPVETEFALSLVDKGLLDRYPDETENLVSFFEKGLERSAEFSSASSVNFRRTGKMRAVARAVLDERRRLADRAKGAALRERFAETEKSVRSMKRRHAPRPSMAPPRLEALLGMANEAPMADELASSGYLQKAEGRSFKAVARGGRRTSAEDDEAPAAAASRRELAIGAWWSGSLRSDSRGRATVAIPMPARTTRYRLRTRAVTRETLLGEGSGELVVRRPFYVDCRLPSELMEGDAVRPMITLHGLEPLKARFNVSVEIHGGSSNRRILLPMDLTAPGSATAVADAFPVPACRDLTVTVTARRDDKVVDRLVKTARVRPWGVLERDGRIGGLSDRAGFTLRLPPSVRGSSKRLVLDLYPSMAPALLAMADEGDESFGPRNHRVTAARAYALLALAHRLRGISGSAARVQRLHDAARACLATLSTAQASDGSWSWISTPSRVGWQRDASTTAWAVAAMHLAKEHGLLADPSRLERALGWLEGRQGQGNHELERFEQLYALSLADQARFSILNRLYRDRGSLGTAQKALLGLAFLRSKKPAYADALVALLKKDLLDRGGSKETDLLAQAMTLSLLSQRSAPEALVLARELEGRMAAPQSGSAERWLALAALSTASPPEGPAAFDLSVSVNGREIGTYQGREGAAPKRFVLEGDALELPAEIVLSLRGRGRAAFRAQLEGFTSKLEGRKIFSWGPSRERHYHSPRLYKGRRLVDSSMTIERLAFHDTAEDGISFESRRRGKSTDGYLTLTRWIPAGARLDRSSVPSSALHVERRGNALTLVFRHRPGAFRLRYLPHCPGRYRCLPSSMVDSQAPWPVERLSEARSLEILAPGENPARPYAWSDAEHRAFGLAHFADGDWAQALTHLNKLDRRHRKSDGELIRALLWIRCRAPWYEAAEVVDLFEILEQRHPTVTLPYEKLLCIGRAYHDRGENEAACYLWRSTMESSWRDDVPVAAELEAAGEYMRAVDYLENLFWIYPNLPVILQSHYGLSQDLYAHKDRAAELSRPEGPLVAEDLVSRAVGLLRDFLALEGNGPVSDEATFSLLAALRDLQAHRSCLEEAQGAARRFAKSKYVDRFRYLAALAAFQLGTYDDAIEAARLVADGKGPDHKYATYILGQMYQALGRFAESRETYRKVRDDFPDAAQAIEYLERRSLELPELVRGQTGEPVALELRYVGTEAVRVMAYRVDLMRLYLKEKNLDRIAGVKLAGITPTFTFERPLPPVPTGTTGKSTISLPIAEEGAYLVLARSGEVFASSLALISPLSLEVQSFADAVRVTVLEGKERKPAQGVHVKVSNGSAFASGESDLRGCATVSLDRGQGRTVVVRRGTDTYAFWRAPRRAEMPTRRMQSRPTAVAFDANIQSANMQIQQRGAQNLRSFFGRRSIEEQGVQARAVRK